MTAPLAALTLVGLVAAGPTDLRELQHRLAQVVAREKGVTGVVVLHVERGQTVDVHGDERFPMQSVYKLPIAIAVLAAHDAGTLPLDRPIEIRAEDVVPMQDNPDAWGNVPLETTVRQLVERMVVESDNTACDKLLALAGGGPAVTRLLGERGLPGITVSRPERQMSADFCRDGAEKADPGDCDLDLAEQRRAIRAQLRRDQDTATPRALAGLLLALQRGTLLTAPSSTWLLSLMEKTIPGSARLKGQLPPGTRVAHRTGTGALVINDIGIITLPDGQHLIVAVLMMKSSRPQPARERTIAVLARVAYDHFTAR